MTYNVLSSSPAEGYNDPLFLLTAVSCKIIPTFNYNSKSYGQTLFIKCTNAINYLLWRQLKEIIAFVAALLIYLYSALRHA